MPAALFVAGKEGGGLKGARSRALERNLGLVLVTPVSGTYPPPNPVLTKPLTRQLPRSRDAHRESMPGLQPRLPFSLQPTCHSPEALGRGSLAGCSATT